VPLVPDSLRLVYSASLTEDNLQLTARRNYKKVSNTLAVLTRGTSTSDVYLHGNSTITVSRGSANVSKNYAVRRRWKIWTAPTDGADPPVRSGAYTLATERLVIDSGQKPPGEWIDAPGIVQKRRQPSAERILLEWVVGGETGYNHELVQGLGGLYFLEIVDITPANYRVGMSRAFPLTEDEIRAAMGISGDPSPLPDGAPLHSEDDLADADWVARHTSWQSYAPYNTQLPVEAP
jgi:hypothetical protein